MDTGKLLKVIEDVQEEEKRDDQTFYYNERYRIDEPRGC